MDLYDKEGNLIDVYDSEGNKVDETLTPDEVDTKIEEAKEEAKATFQKDLEETQGKLNDKEDLLKQKEEELAKLSGKDTNFGKLKESKEKEIETLKTQINALEGKIGEISKGVQEKDIVNAINNIAGGNAELAGKIKFYFDQFTVPQDDTPEKRAERLKNAVTLATGMKPSENALAGGVAGTGMGEPLIPTMDGGDGGKLSKDAIEVAKNLGLDEKDLKKHKLI